MSIRRPPELDPLFRSVESLPGVGPKIAEGLKKLTGPYLLHLLMHAPTHSQFRIALDDPSGEFVEKLVILPFIAIDHRPPVSRKAPYRVVGVSGSEKMELSFFHASRDYLQRQLPTGIPRIVSGELGVFRDSFRMLHPDWIVPEDKADTIPREEPRYALTQGLSMQRLQKALAEALKALPELNDWVEPSLKSKKAWPGFGDAIKILHNPSLGPEKSARERLAYDELLANALALQLVRQFSRKRPALPLSGTGKLQDHLRELLPFQLTRDQNKAVTEIGADLAEPLRMLRLVQGDVGAGKTIVAFMAMLQAVESGRQAVIMAPTAILAQQHFDEIAPLALKLGLKCVLLTGKDKAAERRASRLAVAEGSAQLAVGTHAMFQDSVEFRNLGLAVIDEQHRFGVEQRLKLSNKGEGAHILLMTATPIPRTLLLAEQGDLDTSILKEKPPGRQEIDTRAFSIANIAKVLDGLKRAVEGGAQAYWVCPLVEESEVMDLANVEDRFATLKKVFGDQVVLVHGRLTPEEKDAAMSRFASGQASVLVATTVIEVGVNVPNATIMVIEQAERFGLSQLHQLRGRVGRGSKQSYCFLLFQPTRDSGIPERIEVLKGSTDGFEIAEEDLRIRGAGEVLGTRQSGLPKFRFNGLEEHADLVPAAQMDAKMIITTDPSLRTTERGQAARTLLYLFERDEAARYLVEGA